MVFEDNGEETMALDGKKITFIKRMRVLWR